LSSLTSGDARSSARGYASGALIVSLFGALWALFTFPALGSAQRLLLLVLVVAVTAPLAVQAVRLLRRSGRLPSDSSPEARARGRTARRRYLAVVAGEFIVIFLAANVLGSAGLAPLIPPVIALVVGLHFLPLAAVFRVRLYYLTGALISIPAAVAAVALLMGVTLGNPFGWPVVVGVATAAVLWATAFVLLRTVGRWLA
jgi:hypothetical protein